MTGLVLGISLALIAPALASAAAPDASRLEAEREILAAMDAVWRMDFGGAEAGLERAERALPGYPYASFGRANVTWARYVYDTGQTDESLKKRFETEVDAAIDAAKAWFRDHPEDAEGVLALSGAYGLRSRLAVIQRHWLGALLSGRKAVKLSRKAHRMDPGLYDALLGVGMFDYYADSLPRTVKFFTKLFLRGDRERGIGELESVAEKGRFSKVAAQLLLIEIFTEDAWGAKDPERALSIIRGLRERYPGSPLFHKIEHVCLYEAGRHEELLTSVELYLTRIDEKMPYYPERDRARMLVSRGTSLFAAKRLEDALRAFRAAGRLAGTGEKPERWGVWGLVRLGQVLDALGRRAEAARAYSSAADFPDIWGFRDVAEAGVKEAILLGAAVGQLPPP